jgi:mono/diheme cytochrome c family protein
MSRKLSVLLCAMGVVLAVLSALSIVAAQEPTVHDEGMTPQERLARPPMSDPPTQLELGHAEYWMSCMVCHGDRGQGLTEEWRSVLDPADMNCWQSRCHAPNHPPQGFEIPRQSPLVIGPGALTGYQTASDLFAYMRVYMPWSFPGLFEDDVYWNLTAYLADANGIELPKAPLGPDNGDEVFMVPQLVQTPHTAIEVEQIVASAVVGLLLVAGILYWLIRSL